MSVESTAKRMSYRSCNGATTNNNTRIMDTSAEIISAQNRDDADILLADVGNDALINIAQVSHDTKVDNTITHNDAHWTRVERIRRNYVNRFAIKNESESRSLILWGAHHSLSPLEVAKTLQSKIRAKITPTATITWQGIGEHRHVRIEANNVAGMVTLFTLMKPAAKSMKWHLTHAQSYEERAQKRDTNIAPSAPRNVQTPFETKNSFSSLDVTEDDAATPISKVDINGITINIAALNIGKGMLKKAKEIGDYMDRNKIDILAISEHALKPEHTIIIAGYIWIAPKNNGGNTGFIVSSFIAPFITSLTHNNAQFWVKLSSHAAGRRDIHLCAVYIPNRNLPDEVRAEAFANLSSSVSIFAVTNDIILLGDFNAHIGEPTNIEERTIIGRGDVGGERSSNGKLLMELMTSHQLIASRVTNGATHTRVSWNAQERSMIDFIIATPSLSLSSLIIDTAEGLSDHRPIRVSLSSIARLEKPKKLVVKMWNLKKLEGVTLADYKKKIRDTFRGWSPSTATTHNTRTHTQTSQTRVDTAAESWSTLVNNAARATIGEKSIKRGVSVPWFTPIVADMVREKRKQARIMITSPDLHKARAAAERVRELISLIAIEKQKNRDELEDEAQNAFTSNKSRRFWSIMKMMNGKGKTANSGNVRVKNSKGVTAITDKENRENWASFYYKLANEDGGASGRYDQAHKERVEESLLKWAHKNARRGHMAPFTRKEIKFAVSTLSNGKACGIDRIPNEFIKSGGKAMVSSLVQLFNWIITHEVTPSSWSRGLICNIFKAGAIDLCDNYRGITLLSNVYKLFTKLLAKRLSDYLEGNNSLTPSQCGFRPRRGCPDQAFVLSRIIERRRAIGQHTHLFFLDVKKAFDTVWRDGVWHALSTMDVDPQLWRVIRSVYASTTASVIVNGEHTELFDQTIGVRQGCPLSPLLYVAFVNGMAQEINDLKCGVRITDDINGSGELLSALLFADDVVLTAPSPAALQRMIDCVAAYARRWRFDANVAKCAIMSITAAGAKKAYSPVEFKFDGATIPVVTEYKYLGVLFSSDTKWNKHIEYVRGKVNKSIVAYGAILASRRLHTVTKLRVYESAIRPIMEYASEVWSTDSKTALVLERAQNKAARAVLRCATHTSIGAVLGELGLSPLSIRRDAARVRYYYRIMKKTAPHYSLLAAQYEQRSTVAKGRGVKYNSWMSAAKLDQKSVRFDAAAVKKSSVDDVLNKRIIQRSHQWLQRQCRAPKLDLFRQVKKKRVGLEPWLAGNYTLGARVYMKLRSGTTALGEELDRRARHSKRSGATAEETGLCQLCDARVVETREHFMVECTGLTAQRLELLEKAKRKFGADWESASSLEKTTALLGGRIGGIKRKRADGPMMDAAIKYSSSAWIHRVKTMYPEGPVNERKKVTVKRTQHTNKRHKSQHIESANKTTYNTYQHCPTDLLIMPVGESKRCDNSQSSSPPSILPISLPASINIAVEAISGVSSSIRRTHNTQIAPRSADRAESMSLGLRHA